VQVDENRYILTLVSERDNMRIFVQIFSIMPAKVKTLIELANEYGVCRNTFRKWLKPIEDKLKLCRRPLLEWQVNMIYEFLDKP